jgi:oxygen-independent coproporphyrinogen-3 oxidase
MPAYEVSNHARDGAQSRHNLIYWRYGDYLGIGPGAHGRLTLSGQRFATECHSNPARWLGGAPDGQTEKSRALLSREDQASEFLLMGLRLKEGISLSRYNELSPAPISDKVLDELTYMGMINRSNEQLTVSNQGFMVLNAVIAKLLDA